MRRSLYVLLAMVMVGSAMVPLVPTAAAETVTKTWTQTSQIDFSQGSGDADMFTSPGNVLPGGGVSTNVGAAWTTDRDSGCSNWCFDRYQTGSPYVIPGKGSIYIGRGWYYPSGEACCYRSHEDRISTAAPGQSQFTVYLYPASCYQDRWYDNTYIDQYFRITDANGNQQDTLLRGCATNSWSSYRQYFGPYSSYENLNGWYWYKFVVNVPTHFDKASLRAGLHLQSYTTTCWSCYSQIYMWNYIAFGAPPTSTFVSNVHDAGGLANFDSVAIDGYVPPGASMKLQTRTSGDGITFSDWATALSGEPAPSPPGRFIQYRALFTRGSGGEPYLSEVRTSYSFTVDTNPPRTTASVVGTQGCAAWYVTRPVVVLTALDDLSGVAATFWGLDEGQFKRYTAPFPVGDGVHTLDFYSVDNAGNVEQVKRIGLKADTAVPTTALDIGAPTFLGDKLYVHPESVFTLSASDATSGVKVTRVDTGSGVASYEGPFTLGAGDGPRSVRSASEDRACNLEPPSQADVFVDGTAPSVAILEPEPSSFRILGRDSEDLPPWAEAQNRLAGFGVYGSDADLLAGIAFAGAAEMCGPVLAERCAVLGLSELAPRLGGALVVGDMTVEADAADVIAGGGASGLAFAAFFLDGELRHVDGAAPFTWDWDAGSAAMGKHDLAVLAVDNIGNAAVQGTAVSVVPSEAPGVLDTGGFTLAGAGAPDFARALYDFVRGKVEPNLPQGPPPPPTLPDPNVLLEQVRRMLPPGLPVQPPGGLPEPPVLPPLPRVEPPSGLPPLPPIPQVCVGDVCTPKP